MRQRLTRWLAAPRLPLWVALLGALMTLPTAFTGLTADDHHFRMVLQGFPGLPELAPHPLESSAALDLYTFAHGDAAWNAAAMERGLLPWWTTPGFRLAFFRPLAAWTHALDQVLWPDASIAPHLHNAAWYALLCFVLARLYRRTFGAGWAAGLAALIYALDDSHVVSAGWIAGRNTIMSCIAAVLALAVHDRWRREGWRHGAWLGPACFALGLLCGEAAVGTLAYIAAHAAFIDRDTPGRRILAFSPYVAVAAMWALAHHAMNFGAEGSGLYLDPARSPLAFAATALRHLPLLLMGQLAGINPVLWLLAPEPWPVLHLSAAVALAVLAAWVLWPLARRDAWVRFWAVGMLLSLVPACAVFPQSRLLFLSGVGGMALVPVLIRAWFERRPELRTGFARRTATRGLTYLSILVHMITGPLAVLPSSFALPLFEHRMLLAAQGFPREASIADQRVVIVAMPADILLHAIPYTRSSLRWPSPRHLYGLYAGLGAVEIRRIDARTLDLHTEDSFVSRLWSQMFRGTEAHPFSVGQTVRLEGLSVEVVEVDRHGRAMGARFRFDRPLETAADHWLTWSGSGLVPFALPPVGASVRLPRVGLHEFFRQNVSDFIHSGAWKRMAVVETGPLEPRR